MDYSNIIGTPKELQKAVDYLKKKIEMKNLRRKKFCLDLQIKHLSNRKFLHQSTYIETNLHVVLYG